MTGKTKEVAPKDVIDFRGQLFDFLKSQGFGTALSGAPQDINFAPYREAFAQRRAETLAQAKEGAGNLTGSGFGNIYGAAAGRSVSEENAFLAQLQESARQASADRYSRLLGLPASYVGQQGYQPGFLDYLFKGAQAAASIAGINKNQVPKFGPEPPTREAPSGVYDTGGLA